MEKIKRKKMGKFLKNEKEEDEEREEEADEEEEVEDEQEEEEDEEKDQNLVRPQKEGESVTRPYMAIQSRTVGQEQ